jgi:hypothetical protein
MKVMIIVIRNAHIPLKIGTEGIFELPASSFLKVFKILLLYNNIHLYVLCVLKVLDIIFENSVTSQTII